MSHLSQKKAMLVLRTWVLGIVGGLAWIGFVFFLVRHWEYYGLARAQRPLNEAHSVLRSSGITGLSTGIIAAALVILNLGYLVRKRLIRVTFLGPVRMWMDLHVLTGFIGGGLVVFHCSFALSSALGTLAVIAMATTILTGIVGRTIYIQVPRTLEGRELELGQVQEELTAYREQLEQAGVAADWLNDTPTATNRQTSLVGCFTSMVRGYHQRRRGYRRLRQQVLESPKLAPSARKILPLVKEFCIRSQWFQRYYDLRNLIASWRFFHRWLAILMLCVVACHIIVAIRFGDLWIFGRGP